MRLHEHSRMRLAAVLDAAPAGTCCTGPEVTPPGQHIPVRSDEAPSVGLLVHRGRSIAAPAGVITVGGTR